MRYFFSHWCCHPDRHWYCHPDRHQHCERIRLGLAESGTFQPCRRTWSPARRLTCFPGLASWNQSQARWWVPLHRVVIPGIYADFERTVMFNSSQDESEGTCRRKAGIALQEFCTRKSWDGQNDVISEHLASRGSHLGCFTELGSLVFDGVGSGYNRSLHYSASPSTQSW